MEHAISDAKNSNPANREFRLSALTRQAALRVFEAYCAFDSMRIDEAGMDVVRLKFGSAEGRQRAEGLICRIASADDKARAEALRRFGLKADKYIGPLRECLEELCAKLPNDQSAVGDDESPDKLKNRLSALEQEFRARINDWPKNISQGESRWQALNESLLEMSQIHRAAASLRSRLIRPGQGSGLRKAFPPPSNLVFPGEHTEEWLTLPVRLFLAEEIVAFCDKVSKANATTTIPIEEALLEKAQAHYALMTDCKMESFQVPGRDGGFDLSISSGIQTKLAMFFDALGEFFSMLLQPKFEDEGKEENSPQAQENISINIITPAVIQVRGKPMTSRPAMNMLLALALLRKEPIGAITFTTEELIRKICQRGTVVSKAWYKHKREIARAIPGIKILGSPGNYTVFNLHFEHCPPEPVIERHLRQLRGEEPPPI